MELLEIVVITIPEARCTNSCISNQLLLLKEKKIRRLVGGTWKYLIVKAFESLVMSPEDVIIKLRQKFHLTPHCWHWFNVSDNEAGFAVNIKSKIISNSGKMPGEGFGFVIVSPPFSHLLAYSLPL